MPYIGCTQKLIEELKSKPVSEATGRRGWHGNLFRFVRRKSVLLVNDETRFAVFITGLVKKDFMNFDKVFMEHFEAALGWIGASAGQMAQAKLQIGPFSYGKTYSRSVIGSMNDMKFRTEYMVKNRLGHLPQTDDDLRWITMLLNDTPYNGKDLDGYVFPEREMLKMIDESG